MKRTLVPVFIAVIRSANFEPFMCGISPSEISRSIGVVCCFASADPLHAVACLRRLFAHRVPPWQSASQFSHIDIAGLLLHFAYVAGRSGEPEEKALAKLTPEPPAKFSVIVFGTLPWI